MKRRRSHGAEEIDSGSVGLRSVRGAGAAEHFDGQSWWNTVKVLADDKFEGRDTEAPARSRRKLISCGSSSTRRRARGINGHYQSVKLRTLEIQERARGLALVRDGHAATATWESRHTSGNRITTGPARRCAAGVRLRPQYPGEGLQRSRGARSQEQGGRRIRPELSAEIPSALSAHTNHAPNGGRRSPVPRRSGVIMIPNPGVPWTFRGRALSLNHPTIPAWTWSERNSTRPKGQSSRWYSAPAARRPPSSERTGHTFAEIAASARSAKPSRAFALHISMSATTQTSKHEVGSTNIVAKIYAETTPSLKPNNVVYLRPYRPPRLSAKPINGDQESTAGPWTTGRAAHSCSTSRARSGAHPFPLKRSVLWPRLGHGRGKSLLGSRFFTTHPTNRQPR